MFVFVIDFGDTFHVRQINDERQAKRLYSVLRLIFPSAQITVYEVRKVI